MPLIQPGCFATCRYGVKRWIYFLVLLMSVRDMLDVTKESLDVTKQKLDVTKQKQLDPSLKPC
jgi:hypothetical protein